MLFSRVHKLIALYNIPNIFRLSEGKKIEDDTFNKVIHIINKISTERLGHGERERDRDGHRDRNTRAAGGWGETDRRDAQRE